MEFEQDTEKGVAFESWGVRLQMSKVYENE